MESKNHRIDILRKHIDKWLSSSNDNKQTIAQQIVEAQKN